MAVSNETLGMNARNFLYIKQYNSHEAIQAADDKLVTKERLISATIATPALYASFPNRQSIRTFDWTTLPPVGFALKPARGWGGEGILVFKNWAGEGGNTVSDEYVSREQLETHILDILDGAYSLQFLPDKALAEELIETHAFFKKLSPRGLPDIRIIVLNQVPVMAEVRLPTENSHWTANISHGALGVGVDIRTGITTHAFRRHHRGTLLYIPGTKIKTRGIKIPFWDEMLLLASRTQQASGLGYAGIDLVLSEQRGPMVLEVNARPGLYIQSVNLASIRTRLERIENMRPLTPERAVEISKSLFAEAFSEKVTTAPKVIGIIEDVVLDLNGTEKLYPAKIDTGAFRTSVDRSIVKSLNLQLLPDKIYMRSASGRQARTAVKLNFLLRGNRVKTVASVANRGHLNYPIIIGRNDLKGFLVDPTRNAPIESPEQIKGA